MLKSAPYAAPHTIAAAAIAVVDFRMVRIGISPSSCMFELAALIFRSSGGARNYDCIRLFPHMQAENGAGHAREQLDIVGGEIGTDHAAAGACVRDNDLLCVVAVEFGSGVGKRCVVEEQHAPAPAKLAGCLGRRQGAH